MVFLSFADVFKVAPGEVLVWGGVLFLGFFLFWGFFFDFGLNARLRVSF